MAAAFLFMILLTGVIVTSVVFFQKSKKLESQQMLPPGYGGGGGGGFTPAGQLPPGQDLNSPRGLMNLKLNDIISYYGTDYTIEGRLDFWEDGYTWITYMLVDMDDIKWLSVEDDDSLEVSLWEEVKDVPVSQPFPETVDYRGQTFRMQERGKARVNQKGRTGNKTGLQVEYYEYESREGEKMSIEKWGPEVEVSIGRDIRPDDLDIFPGDEVEY